MIFPRAPAHRGGTDDEGSPQMISDAYLRARIAEVQQEFAAARRWLRGVTRLLARARKARNRRSCQITDNPAG